MHLMCIVAFVLAASSCGCARSAKTLNLARDAFAAGDFAAATETLHEISQEDPKLSSPAELDLAMIELANENPESAERRLKRLRDHFDRQPKISPLGESTALIKDDLSRPFRPAGYEQVMIRSMLSICSLVTDQVDAESYALQANMKQKELADFAESRGLIGSKSDFQPIALAPYLRGVLRESTHHDYDDAVRAYSLVTNLQPNFAPAAADLARASSGVHSESGNGVLHVIACVGRGPVLEESIAETTTASLAFASQILNRSDEDGNPVLPNVASVKVPRVTLPPSNVATISVGINSNTLGVTETITDVAQLAATQVQIEMPWTIARAVVRRVLKEAAVAELGDQIGLQGQAASIFRFGVGSAWSSSEKADTRCWGMLPREIQVLRVELPAGDQLVSFTPVGFEGQPIGPPKSRLVQIADGRSQFLLIIAPHSRMHLVSSKR